MNTHHNKKHERGFFKLLALIIIAAAILTFFGYNPKVIWDSYIVPVIIWLWEVLYAIISFIIDIVMSFVIALRS